MGNPLIAGFVDKQHETKNLGVERQNDWGQSKPFRLPWGSLCNVWRIFPMDNLSSLMYASLESGHKIFIRVNLHLQLQCWWCHINFNLKLRV